MFKIGDKVKVVMEHWTKAHNTGVIKDINPDDEWPVHVLMDFMCDEDDEDELLNSFRSHELVAIVNESLCDAL